jgi:hypothetical protein
LRPKSKALSSTRLRVARAQVLGVQGVGVSVQVEVPGAGPPDGEPAHQVPLVEVGGDAAGVAPVRLADVVAERRREQQVDLDPGVQGPDPVDRGRVLLELARQRLAVGGLGLAEARRARPIDQPARSIPDHLVVGVALALPAGLDVGPSKRRGTASRTPPMAPDP